jgi:predicted phage terminase large subunit-like protein
MTTRQQDIVDALARESLFYFAILAFPVVYPGQTLEDAEYLRLLASRLMQMQARETNRLIVNLAPRLLKSYLSTICLTAWLLGKDPRLRIMIASHTLTLSATHLNSIRRLLKSEVYRRLFPSTHVGSGKDNETEVETDAGGRVLAVSFEAAPTGRGCDGLIVDDPLKADDAHSKDALDSCERFYREALLSRLDHPIHNFALVVMQRLAEQDLAGRLAANRSYEVLALPLVAVEDERYPYSDVTGSHVFTRAIGQIINPARMTEESVATLEAEFTDAAYAAQFQQRPLGTGTRMIKPEWLSYIDTPLKNPRLIVQSWDTASAQSEGSSFSVCLTWRIHDNGFELIDVFRGRVTPEQIPVLATQFAQRHHIRVALVEEANTGYVVGYALKQIPGVEVEMIPPKRKKEERLNECLSAFVNRKVLLPRSAEWLPEYEDELLAFPGGRHDDQVDATSMFLNWAMPRVSGEIRDPFFQEKLLSRGISSGGPRVLMQVGRGIHEMGKPPSLRPRLKWK